MAPEASVLRFDISMLLLDDFEKRAGSNILSKNTAADLCEDHPFGRGAAGENHYPLP